MKYKHINAFHRGHKVPRKVKKACLSRKLSSTQLKLKINQWMKDGEMHNTFCPKCGEGGERFIYHKEVEYPEVWTEGFCLRCGTNTSWQDNSPWYHLLSVMREDIELPLTVVK